MADFPTCLDWVLGFEDPQRTYEPHPDEPPGAHALAGINSNAYPEDYARIAALSPEQRPPAVAEFYRDKYWRYDEVKSDEVAKRVMDASVNMDFRIGVRLLQTAIAEMKGPALEVDGLWGPLTLKAANSCDPLQLVASFRTVRSNRYRSLVEHNPRFEKYLKGWLRRAEA